jgi:cell division septation protein DedD
MTVNRPYDDDELPLRGYGERRADPNRADREISLGTPTILGIFFVLALVCAAFFGFGYSMGRKSTQTAQLAIPPSGASPTLSANATKPSAGSLPFQRLQPNPQPSEDTSNPAGAPQTATVSLTQPAAPKSTVAPSDRIIAGDKPTPTPTQPATTNLQPATSFMVQVAAVSTQDVADIEVAALKKQGFDVVVRHEPQDKLLHVQIGPFPDRKSAEAMRARVLAGGFNAIVK